MAYFKTPQNSKPGFFFFKPVGWALKTGFLNPGLIAGFEQ